MTRLIAVLGVTSVLAVAIAPVRDAPRNPGAEFDRVDPESARDGLGRSVTLLPDGGLLILGGEGPGGPVAHGVIRAPSGRTTPLTARLGEARAWHSATLLPDGSVLVLGGIGVDGQVVESAELLRPGAEAFERVPSPGLLPRADHSATLLTDGLVLVVGGTAGEGDAVATAELWDPFTWTTVPMAARLSAPRHGHSATLSRDGSVILWGGARGADELHDGERFDPERGAFMPISSPPVDDDAVAPSLEASIPGPGATDVPVDAVLALRFSRALRVESANAANVILGGPGGVVDAAVVPAERGRLVFVTPGATLRAGSVYTLALDGLIDASGVALPAVDITFVTARDESRDSDQNAAPSTPSPTDGRALAGAADDLVWKGARRDGRPYSPWQALPALRARPGVTALAAQVLALDGEPLAGVVARIGKIAAHTDATGRFLLAGIPEGHQEMLLDARRTNRSGDHGVFEIAVEAVAGQTTILPFTSWLPKIDEEHAVTVASPTSAEVVVTTPRLPGLELHLPKGTAIRDHEGRIASRVSITPIPPDRPPFPLPGGVDTPAYFTIQPGAGYVEGPGYGGARLVYPNFTDARRQPPGARFDFWHYEPGDRGWRVYGQGSVDPSGDQVVPDRGVVIHEFTGAMINNGRSGPPEWEPAGGLAWDGEPVGLSSGLFVLTRTDLYVPDVMPLVLSRTYRPKDVAPRPFGIGATHPYEMFLWSAAEYQEADLILPDGARIHYVRISPGVGAGDMVLEHTTTPTIFYKSRIVRGPGAGWDLMLRDGTVYRFGEGAPLQSIRDRHGNTISITRASPNGNVTRVTSPSGRWIDFSYDAANRIAQARDTMGRTVGYAYDASGRVAAVTDAAGGVTRYAYDASHRMVTLTDARGIAFLQNEYDAAGRVTQQTQADGSVYRFGYTLDATGRITQTDVTDPRGAVRRVAFNASGYTVSDTRALGSAEQQGVSYERQAGSHLILSTTDALGRRTSYTYDAVGNVTAVTRLAGTPGAVTASFAYEPVFSQVTSMTDPLGRVTAFGRDARGDLATVTDPVGRQTSFSYDGMGQPLTMSDAAGTTRFAYDLADLIAVTDPLGNVSARFVDAASRMVTAADPLGQTTRYEYDPLNQVRRAIDPRGGVTAFDYDANGNLLGLTDARGGATRYTYDSRDRAVSRIDPTSRAETRGYDANGNAVAITDRKGQASSFSYDALNRLTRATYGDGASVAYTWDAGNRLTRAVDSAAGTISRSFDLLDRLVQEVTPQGTVNYTYDAAGQRVSMTVIGQQPVTYGYDASGRLTQVSQGVLTARFTYDAAGRRATLTLPNGVVTQYAYDAASRLTGLTYLSGSVVLGTLTYAYDGASNRAQVGGTWARTGLPPVLASASYDAANRQLTFGGQALAYDLNGNLTSDGANTYVWNARNQLVSFTGPGLAAAFTYDALGRRQSKTFNGVTTQFLYDGLNPVREQTGAAVVSMLTGLDIDEYLTRTDASGSRHVLPGVLGSSLAMLDNAGIVRTEYTYEPFGLTSRSGSSDDNPFQYTGRENDSTGLYYYRARYYHPRFSRFIGEDPARFRGGDVNLYAYVGNRPTRSIDPLGLWVVVSLYRCCLGANHLGIGVNVGPLETVGYYPQAHHSPLSDGVVIPDSLRATPQELIDFVILDTKPEQERAILAFIEQRRRNPSQYVLLTRNCGNFVQDALQAGGIDPIGQSVAIPQSIFDGLKASNLKILPPP